MRNSFDFVALAAAVAASVAFEAPGVAETAEDYHRVVEALAAAAAVAGRSLSVAAVAVGVLGDSLGSEPLASCNSDCIELSDPWWLLQRRHVVAARK